MIRFIHTADLHLDSPFKGLKQLHPKLYDRVYQSTFQAFERLVTLAIQEAVDFMVIAGDIYDGDNQSVKAQAFFRDQMTRLKTAQIPVFLSHGNHDFMDNGTSRLQMPSNVTVLGNQPETHYLNNTAITGFSYPKRWVTERMIDKYPKRANTEFHIGLLHGYLEGSASAEDVYAPFTITDLLNKQYDYWALGHIHKRQVLIQQPPIVYPGNTQGRNPNELDEKGAFLVTLQKGMEPTLTFVNTAPIWWKEKTISLLGIHTLDVLYTKIAEEIARAEKPDQTILLSLKLDDREALPDDVITRIHNGDLLAGISQSENVYLYRISLAPKKERLVFSADDRMQQSFNRSKEHLSHDETYRRVLQDLFKHPTVRTRFADLEQDRHLKTTILQEAEELLLEDIVFEEGESINED
ncbi:metallophosphoesterase family protein [Jeotgalibaca sp. A127]|uniref:metallophosphoesterase family protein n=1 Tax=Jeotgalibaca sp. A127 TaxID=3457324 RepID=UPI003FD6651D